MGSGVGNETVSQTEDRLAVPQSAAGASVISVRESSTIRPPKGERYVIF